MTLCQSVAYQGVVFPGDIAGLPHSKFLHPQPSVTLRIQEKSNQDLGWQFVILINRYQAIHNRSTSQCLRSMRTNVTLIHFLTCAFTFLFDSSYKINHWVIADRCLGLTFLFGDDLTTDLIINDIQQRQNHWRIQGGARDASPPWGSKFFYFHALFGKKLKNNGTFGSWRTPLGKILDPPLRTLRGMVKQFPYPKYEDSWKSVACCAWFPHSQCTDQGCTALVNGGIYMKRRRHHLLVNS